MKISIEQGPVESVTTDVLIVPVFEGQPSDRVPQDLYEGGEVTGKPLEFTLLHLATGGGGKTRRLLIAGAGKAEGFDAARLRTLAAAAVRFLKGKSIGKAAFSLAGFSIPEMVEATVEGALAGDYDFDLHKSDKKASRFIAELTIVADAEGLEPALERGRILGDAQNFARMLGNEPPNLLTPLVLADYARKMAAQYGLEIEVLDRERMTQLGFGALLGVAMGSAQPPVLIVLRYRPEGGQTPGGQHLGLVGKAVTFDSGGISIKPAEGMDQMKYDMMGGACMIAAMQAIAQLKPAIPVTAVVASVENMLGSRAQRPGDIVTTLSGKTVEMLNTDAEGRMILADALTYAIRLGCTQLVDAATLTGAVVVALGHTFTGVFGDDALVARWMTAAEREGERMWRLPVDEEYKDRLKSSCADLQNIGGRWGGASIAANFLKEFVDSTPWVHLDIAGTAWLEEAKPWMAKGPTGTTVRSFVRLATDWK